MRVRAFCERSSAPYAAHRGHGTGSLASASATQVWGAIQRTTAGRTALRYLSEDYHNASALSGTTCALQSVNRAGKQTEKRTSTYKGRSGHRNARTGHRTARSGQILVCWAPGCREVLIVTGINRTTTLSLAHSGSTDHGIRLRHLCMQVVLVEECKPSGARLPEGLLVSKLPAILV